MGSVILLVRGKFTRIAYPGAVYTQAHGVNNRGQIVGTTSDPDLTTFHGFQLTKGAAGPVTQIDVPGSPNTSVFGIDDRGRIIGVYESPNATPTALRLPAAAMPLGPLGLTSQKSR